MSGNTPEHPQNFAEKQDSTSGGKPMEVIITSFGYKKDPPPTANVVFDVRFLKNPYWVEELRPLSGKDLPVQEYVLSQELAQEFLASLVGMLRKILPKMAEAHHERYTIALGCTGGQHRSATLVEALAKELACAFPECKISTHHRELDDVPSKHSAHGEKDKHHDVNAALQHISHGKGTGR
jgi:RNase adapter protein RapZ